MTVQIPMLTPYQAELRQAHRLRQRRFAEAARKKKAAPAQIEITQRRPRWKTSEIFFDAHVKSYQLHLANRLVRPEVVYLKRRCAELGVSYADIIGRTSPRRVVELRRLLMWEIREKFSLSFFDVGRAFGGRDQSTAISAIKAIHGKADLLSSRVARPKGAAH